MAFHVHTCPYLLTSSNNQLIAQCIVQINPFPFFLSLIRFFCWMIFIFFHVQKLFFVHKIREFPFHLPKKMFELLKRLAKGAQKNKWRMKNVSVAFWLEFPFFWRKLMTKVVSTKESSLSFFHVLLKSSNVQPMAVAWMALLLKKIECH